MQNVPAALAHVCSQRTSTLLVDYLKVGHEGPSEVAHGTRTYFNAIAVGELDPDLFSLAALHEPREADRGDHIEGMIRPGGDDSPEFSRASRWKVAVLGAVALPLNCQEPAIGRRDDFPFPRKADGQGCPAGVAAVSVP